MAVFNSPTEFSDYKKYVPLLKKALVIVLPGTNAHFVYYKEFPFADKKRPCVLVDFGPKCVDEIKAMKKLTPTAAGKVTLNLSNQLQFTPEHGEFKALVVKKEFETMGAGIKEVYVDANESDGAATGNQAAPPQSAPPKAAPLRSPQIPPRLVPEALKRPGAGQPGSGQPGGVPAKGAAATAAPSATQTNAPPQTPPKPARPGAAAPAAKPVDKPVIAGAFSLTGTEEERTAKLNNWLAALAKAKLPITDDHKKKWLGDAERFFKAGKPEEALKIINAMARTVQYPGVADWALDAASRKYELEFFGEQCHAIALLIDQKSAGSNQWQAEKAGALKLANTAMDCLKILEEGLAAADPAKVKAAYEAWIRLGQERKRIADRLKPMWLADQNQRMLAEAGKSKASHNVRVANGYGKEAMLEMAQMAEVQALEYKKRRATDALAQGDWHKKLEVSELAAIYGYSTADYTPIGKLLRAKRDTTEQLEALKSLLAKYGDYIKAAESGLAKLPLYTGQGVIRCTKSLWQGTIDEIARTGVHVEKSFMSVGKKKVTGFGDIEWHFDKFTTGKDISMFSLHQSEGEILFPPGAKFKFVRGELPNPNGGEPIKIPNHTQFASHVTPETKAGVFVFEQVG